LFIQQLENGFNIADRERWVGQTKEQVLDEFRTSDTHAVTMAHGGWPGHGIRGGRAIKIFLRRKGVWYLAQLIGMPLNE
jgi:hypothetical protein